MRPASAGPLNSVFCGGIMGCASTLRAFCGKIIGKSEMEGQFMLTIRNETLTDRQAVEDVTRRAFYNVYVPGCTEHYLVHVMREHPDFIPELDFVAELDGRIIGNVMYTRATLTDEAGAVRDILTFGPVSIAPEHQRRGYGRLLLEHSFRRAAELGWETVVIFGSPANYVGRGFKSCRKFNVCVEGGRFPSAMLVRELKEGALDGRRWVYRDSPVMAIDVAEARRYDDALEPMAKEYRPSQEEFYIMSRSAVDPDA